MKKKLPILIFLSIFLASLFFVLKINAQGNTRVITIVPPSIERSLNPGETAEGILKVVNDSNEALTFDVMIRDYIVKDNQGTPEVLPPNTLSNKYSASAWLGVYPSRFTLPAHKRQELNYYLQVPPDARPGGHYTAVMYQPLERVGVKGTGAAVETHIGTLFYIHVKGDIREDAKVLAFDAKKFNEYGPVKINTEILNNGDLHVRPKGSITVTNMFGQRVATQALSEHNIFPEREFLYTNNFGQKWMIGRYTARLAATYGLNGNLPLVAVTSFIVFPWKVASIAVLLVVVAILSVIAIRRKRKKGSHHETSEQSPLSTDHPAL